jgi:hypothetical protein
LKLRDSAIRLSATDLANHLSCQHLTTLDVRLAKGEIEEPAWENPHLQVLQQRGLEHESAYIESLRSKGHAIVDLSGEMNEDAREQTLAAMTGGAAVIVQGSFSQGAWRGRSDVLLRVEQPQKEKRFWRLVVRSRRLQTCAEHQSGDYSAALPLFGASRRGPGLPSGIVSRDSAGRFFRTRIVPARFLWRVLSRSQTGSSRGREYRISRDISGTGESLRPLPLVEGVR